MNLWRREGAGEIKKQLTRLHPPGCVRADCFLELANKDTPKNQALQGHQNGCRLTSALGREPPIGRNGIAILKRSQSGQKQKLTDHHFHAQAMPDLSAYIQFKAQQESIGNVNGQIEVLSAILSLSSGSLVFTGEA